MSDSVRSRGVRGALAACIGACALVAALAPRAGADPATTLTLDPAATEIHFEVDSTLHRVHGTARLLAGEVHFDPAGGPASGAIEVDATSLDTDNSLRDKRLHGEILESDKYPRIVFHPTKLLLPAAGEPATDVRVEGTMDLHGGSFPLTIPATVHRTADAVELDAHFSVPYVEWGLEDPSNFLLHVDKVVDVSVHAKGRVEPAPQ